MKSPRWSNIFLLSFLFMSTLNAQIISHYGIKVSVVRSNFSVKDKPPVVTIGGLPLQYSYPDEALVHPAIGIYTQHAISDNWGIEAELSYLPKGGCQTYTLLVSTETSPNFGETKQFRSEANLQYLEFGVNIQPKVGFGSTAVYASIGPTVEYNVSVGNLTKEDVKDVVFGYTAGIGLDINTQGQIPLFIEAKYNGDFSSVYSVHGNYWNQAFIMSLGFRL